MQPPDAQRLLFWAPKASTALSFLIVMGNPALVAGSVALVYAVGAAVTIASMATLVMLAKRAFRHDVTLTGLVIQAALLILNFAAIHYAFGMHDPVTQGIRHVSFGNALYFSIVTWTTLGYGDYTPAEALQLLAALEAAIGYIYLGLIVGLAANLFPRRP